ncbi:hypothetical protein Sarmat_01125 [Rickettsiales endosymbiont of Paramecium tredecaurelia]|uniref:hypothetical protein n=1 Tax=Candidatus Sarmatiella mevalonica TaxID=2770581 RepID=UPI001920B505|nr:hypothetical protein [Candidatus Sarmatiella mevalonica]MBL3285253.1 hypothetical protein [Candidatus Sarmatiella mevalonica]
MRGVYEVQSRSVHEVREDLRIDSVATVAIRSEFRKRSNNHEQPSSPFTLANC